MTSAQTVRGQLRFSRRSVPRMQGEPLSRWLILPIGLWLLAWGALNAGPWNFDEFDKGAFGTLNAVRAALPLVVFLLGGLAMLVVARPRARSWAELGFWIYGICALVACTGAKDWFTQAYWGLAFLGLLAAMELALRQQDSFAVLEKLNWLSWIITVAALVAMLFLARDVLMAPGADDSAYGLINRFQDAHGYGIARETGLSRMAAVPAIISLVFLLSGRGWQRLVSIAVFAGSAYIIWIMQSRGALFSFLGGFLFVLLYGRKRGQGTTTFVTVLLVISLVFLVVSQADLHDIWLHATREQGVKGLETASGRFDIYSQLLAEWWKSPLLGYGPQADRLFGVNAQNAFIYALICGGIIGATFFVIAMISAWRALLGLIPLATGLPDRERLMFQIAGGLLVFSTLRSLPENNAALFSVDLLLQYPAMLYLVALTHRHQVGSRLSASARLGDGPIFKSLLSSKA